MRVSFDTMKAEFIRVLLSIGFSEKRADICAALFAEASRDGVYTHGLNRFPRFIEYINNGWVDIHASPVLEHGFGAFERYDGMRGPGNLNAYQSMSRAVELAKVHGIACVALRNTNHWMRGGSYGWQAADKKCAALCFTNTLPNLPPWGGKNAMLGNNPLVFALPRPEGHIVVDMAMSQFSYGKMESTASKDELLPVDGGFDINGNLTRDPKLILESRRPLPAGYWKGSALSTVLDFAAAMLSGGLTTHGIGKHEAEYGVSQVFIAIDCSQGVAPAAHQMIEDAIENLHQTEPVSPDGKVYYPGERTLAVRNENIENGIPVDEALWKKVCSL
jgi:3-dehydro-L-gulonate 2-dehydrogenase